MKKYIKTILIIIILLIVLMFPIPSAYKDGGTKTFTSLTYKVIVWKQMTDVNNTKTGTELHLFPNNFHDLDYYK